MADGVVQLVARLASMSGLPADTSENVINCGLTGILAPADVSDALEAMRDFYITLGVGQTTTVAGYISGTVNRAVNACEILAYSTLDLTGVTPMGSPVAQLSFTMGPEAAASDLPEEVAVVISYNADLSNIPVSEPNPTPPPATIRPAQRRRGRMFIGPLNISAGGVESGSFWRPLTTMRTNLGIAFDTMANAINATAGLELGVWSKADAEVYTAVGGYVDNAWDTQRRRGVEATSRTTFTI